MNSAKMLVRAIRGPILLIALGLLFVADHFTAYSFWRLSPVLLIVYGALWFLERMVTDRDIGPDAQAGGSL